MSRFVAEQREDEWYIVEKSGKKREFVGRASSEEAAKDGARALNAYWRART